MIESLCESCVHLREVISGKGSRFLLCLLSRSDPSFSRYPAQPVLRCRGYSPRPAGPSASTQDSPQDGGTPRT